MDYDPRAHGALCDRCILADAAGCPRIVYDRTGRNSHAACVGPENVGATTAVVARNPGLEEVEKARPQIGRFGMTVTKAVKIAGLERRDVLWTNAYACFDPDDRPDAKLRSSAKKAGRLLPADACRPRLLAELADSENIVTLGKDAALTLLVGRTKTRKMDQLRGTCEVIPRFDAEGQSIAGLTWKVAPTIANFNRKRRFYKVFRRDVVRAACWFRGEIDERPPRVEVLRASAWGRTGREDPAALRRVLSWLRSLRGGIWVCDVETTARDVLDAELLCIGIGDDDVARVIPIKSKEPLDGTPEGEPLAYPRYWSPSEERQIAEAFAAVWIDPETTWIGHNLGYYDVQVLGRWLDDYAGGTVRRRWTPPSYIDTLLLARLADPELPHDLGTAVSLYLDEVTPAWKSNHTATTAREDKPLYAYNGQDVCFNSRLAPKLADVVADREQDTVLAYDHRMQQAAVGLKQNGLRVIQATREKLLTAYAAELEHWHAEAYRLLRETGIDPETAGRVKVTKKLGEQRLPLNLNSNAQVGKIVFDTWNLPIPLGVPPRAAWTAGGERALGKKILAAMYADTTNPKPMRDFLEANRQVRKRVKAIGTYLRRTGLGPASWIRSDGRLHADWGLGTGVGRLSSSDPNAANWPKNLRAMFAPADGNVYVYADWSALHLRIIAALWRIPSLLEGFAKGLDVHALFSGLVYGDDFWKADGHPDPTVRGASGDYTGQAGTMRSVCKTVRYGGCYDAEPTTLRMIVALTEDKKTGGLPYAAIPQARIDQIYEMWHRTEPEWRVAWAGCRERWKVNGYLKSPILGRRCDFEDGWVVDDAKRWDDEDDGIRGHVGNVLVNYEILSCEGDIGTITTTELMDAIPFGYAGPGTGLVQQNYDSFLFEVPRRDAHRVAGIVHDAMNRRFRQLPDVRLVADVKIGGVTVGKDGKPLENTWKGVC